MSVNSKVADLCYAACGIAEEVDEIKLKECDDCGDACHGDHKSQYEEECEKRVAELRDELLFRQPESSHWGDCPICCLPVPLDVEIRVMSCCSKVICDGCFCANLGREIEGRCTQTCPFCRELVPETDEEWDKQRMKRIEMNDPVALRVEGIVQHNEGDDISAFHWYTKAAELGDVEAHYRLSIAYQDGKGVEKDEGKKVFHLEEAAIGGHPLARICLGCHELTHGNIETARKHYVIAATQGDEDGIKCVVEMFRMGIVSREDLAATLRAHQTAVCATKSPHRGAVLNKDNKVTDLCCASCGIAEIDEIKLKECDGCDLVRYCSDECQRDHKVQHEGACKKRAAELREELLFKQPESSDLGDCPICCLPLSLDLKESSLYDCCSKVICKGCDIANVKREMEMRLAPSCPFCREPESETKEEVAERRMKRMEVNDPVAIRQEGGERYKQGDYCSAFEYFTKAADLGDAVAHYRLAAMYHEGYGVEKDIGKSNYHMEEASIGGNPRARYNLGCHEFNRGNVERAMKHYFIAATQGDDLSMKCLMEMFKMGFVNKEELAAVLRAHQAAVDATKSLQREEALALNNN